MLTFDISSAGWKEGIKEFFFSLLKTGIAAIAAVVIIKLDNLHIANFVKPEYALYGTLIVAGIRALITSLWKWATTSEPQRDATGSVVGSIQSTLGDGSQIA